jgi:hypothetical protein
MRAVAAPRPEAPPVMMKTWFLISISAPDSLSLIIKLSMIPPEKTKAAEAAFAGCESAISR